MANRSRRDVGRCRSEANASPSAVARTVCAPGSVGTAITSTAGCVSFYQSSCRWSDAKRIWARSSSTNWWLRLTCPSRQVTHTVLDAIAPELNECPRKTPAIKTTRHRPAHAGGVASTEGEATERPWAPAAEN